MNIDKRSLLHRLEERIKFLKDVTENQETIKELEYIKTQIISGEHDIKVWQ